MTENTKLKQIADQVRDRAAALLPPASPPAPLETSFVKQCLDANERGDGVMFASLNHGKYLLNITPKDGEWFRWTSHVWEHDDFKSSTNAVEGCALEYQSRADQLRDEIELHGIDKKHEDAWKLSLEKKYQSRADRLRSADGASKVLKWAPVVDTSMACKEEHFDQHPWLLPVQNGVLDLQRGILTTGRHEDLLTKSIALEFDPHADYAPWQSFIDEVSGGPEISSFIKRSFGCAITGHAYEQHIWVFTGPGRNGKGVMFDLIADIMGPYFHEISRAMLIEQKSEPSPNSTSEHLYSLLGKRIILGSETNKGQKIDCSGIKDLTGENIITCRPLFRSQINFNPSHNLFLQTNHIPVGLTKDFATVQRLLKIDFPYMYVDDVEDEKKRYPALASRFRLKDGLLKEKLRQIKPGILRWLVEGCQEWQQLGLSPPSSIKSGVDALATEEDTVGQFVSDCLIEHYDCPELRTSTADLYDAFKWWWSQNMDDREQRIPSMKFVNSALRDRGHTVTAQSGRTWLYKHLINQEIAADVAAYVKRHN